MLFKGYFKARRELQALDDYMSMEHPHAKGQTVYDRVVEILENQQTELKFLAHQIEQLRGRRRPSYPPPYPAHKAPPYVEPPKPVPAPTAPPTTMVYEPQPDIGYVFRGWPRDASTEPPFRSGGGGDFGGGGADASWGEPTRSASLVGQDVALGLVTGMTPDLPGEGKTEIEEPGLKIERLDANEGAFAAPTDDSDNESPADSGGSDSSSSDDSSSDSGSSDD